MGGFVAKSVALVSGSQVAEKLESTVAQPELGDEIAALSTHIEATSVRLLDLIREFDAIRSTGNRD
jgi:hypothetical protein